MLARPTACCRAAQRHTRKPQGCIWITDDVLDRVLQQFCASSRLSRRNGSSVPGPLESRRRLMKRRITYASESVHAPMQHLGILWRMNGTIDPSQWQWEPPTRRPPANTTEPRSWLPPWLPDYLPAWEEDQTVLPETNAEQAPPATQLGSIEEDVRCFRASMRLASPEKIDDICQAFNESLKHSLMLGMVPEHNIIATMRHAAREIRKSSPSKSLELSRCFLLYSATWDGIKTSKVLGPTDLVQVIRRLLFHLCRQPLGIGVQELCTDILCTLPSPVTLLNDPALALARKFMSIKWILDTPADLLRTQDPTEDVYIQSFQTSIQFVAALANTIGRHPSESEYEFLKSCTEQLIATTFKHFSGPMRILRLMRVSWLKMIANLSCTREKLLIEIWHMMESRPSAGDSSGIYFPSIPSTTLKETCDVLMNYWIRLGRLEHPMIVQQRFEASLSNPGSTNAAVDLFAAVADDPRGLNSYAKSLFSFLRSLQRPHAINTILRALSDTNMKLSPKVLVSEIKEMSRIDAGCALNMFKLYPDLCATGVPLRLDACPRLISALIQDADINPVEIWAALKVKQKEKNSWRHSSQKRLDETRITTVYKMAMEFARVEHRPIRVALRNVMRCVQYLDRHGEPASPELSRIVSYVGLGRQLSDNGRIGMSKLQWVLRNVQMAEGKDVSEALEKIVVILQAHSAEKSRRQQREGNPLRVRLI